MKYITIFIDTPDNKSDIVKDILLSLLLYFNNEKRRIYANETKI